MRVRNLMVKPSSARGNDMIKVRWFARISDGDGHFTLNTGSNEGTTGKTEFDILANQDTDIRASQSNANIDRVTKLPDCRLCLALKATALVDMTVNILTARQKDKSIWLPSKKREFAMAAGRTSILSAEISHVQGIRDSFSVRPVLANVQPQGTDVLHVNDMTLVTGEEKEIMDLLDVGAFTALTAPYAAVPAGGGGVFLLALVILTGGWPHENRESMHRPQGAQEADIVGRRVAHRHQGGGWLANRLCRQRGPITIERQYPGNGCLRTGRWDKHIPSGESFLRRFGFQGGAGLAAMLKSRTVGGGDHGCRLLHRGDGTLLNGLGVAA